MARKLPPPREAVMAIYSWIIEATDQQPPRAALAAACRATLYTLETIAPGASVEVRVPPFAAIQCIPGPAHTRGTPPNIVEMDPKTWLRLACGLEEFADNPRISASGTRAQEISGYLPIVKVSAR
ncbi:sterol carrier family protein [Corynebacterium sp. ES2794-CONJ1]|uniref:sterol carrier family protein n=1 Tax=unclassified Corynebacterium TaxID=2624378 RepID=UPI002168B16C|nr:MULTISPECIES: sterol carrier family protein [unclassified Corynebacterium]MCS4490298.1 sterol carrier family protein [Corynebacterium sp. ES2775-CONJ]MCS4491891.1 sterol carrier family protein [Corynebacterium sp. ES2715-CONJ3]MCS4531996.1 sterol carrier family protein [Corynebacterium sp. ES2730-CONJ]MCU9519397.1 sterol carrier family protein [Corynebacterium sp. ES2794-CONJ1]